MQYCAYPLPCSEVSMAILEWTALEKLYKMKGMSSMPHKPNLLLSFG